MEVKAGQGASVGWGRLKSGAGWISLDYATRLAYSSWERGTNEVTNKMIRRKIPKGTNFDDRTEEEVESIENWINGYPRKIHGYHSAGELFEEEVKQLA